MFDVPISISMITQSEIKLLLLFLLVMVATCQLSSCTCRLVKKLRLILQATYTHSKNLAGFVLTYKALLLLLQQVESSQKTYHSFIAAFIGGYVIWGKFNKINEQVRLRRLQDPLPPSSTGVVPHYMMFCCLCETFILSQFPIYNRTPSRFPVTI